ncbi:MAG: LysE family transporter [Corynebacterium sp.]|nr:LysE family transporter [Corynebacterium sp.]
MPLVQLGTLVLLNVAGMLTPGPDLFLVTRMATKSRKHAFASVMGASTGLTLWVSLTVFGAAALLITYPAIESVIQLVGGLWLVWMGRGMIQSARVQFRERLAPAKDATALLGSPFKSYQQGLITNLSNPKAVLYFSAVIAPFMPSNPTLFDALLIIVGIVGSTFLGFSTLAFILSTHVMQKGFMKAGPYIDLGSGIFFVVAGLILAIKGAATLLGAK